MLLDLCRRFTNDIDPSKSGALPMNFDSDPDGFLDAFLQALDEPLNRS